MRWHERIWAWPDGWVWRVTRRMTGRSRRRRFELFQSVMRPTSSDRVLDVGVGEGEGRNVNFFEAWYAWPRQITAVALEDLPIFRGAFPNVKFVIGDGTRLPFKNHEFDFAFSNAVLEHVGSRSAQRRFIAEACRVANRIFLSTPNRWFPVDAHTMIPFAHWLPMQWRNVIYRILGRKSYASERALRLVGARELLMMVPRGCRGRILRQRMFGWTSQLILVVDR